MQKNVNTLSSNQKFGDDIMDEIAELINCCPQKYRPTCKKCMLNNVTCEVSYLGGASVLATELSWTIHMQLLTTVYCR